LRERILNDAVSSNTFDLELPIVFAGTGAAIACTLLALFQKTPGELLLIDPYFIQHRVAAEISGARIVDVEADPGFRLPIGAIKERITSSTRAILLCSPNNPTGAVYTLSELDQLSVLAAEHDLYIVSDEIYRDLVFNHGEVAPSLLGRYRKAIVVRGASKALGAAGWRVGWAFVPATIRSTVCYYHKMLYTCAPTPFQVALSGGPLSIELEVKSQIAANADCVRDILGPLYQLTSLEGGYFAFPKAPCGLTGTSVFLKALSLGVGILPGRLFSQRDTHFRFTIAAPTDLIAEACKVLATIAASSTRDSDLPIGHCL
jgi:aspartate aminotransferase/aminotransferase